MPRAKTLDKYGGIRAIIPHVHFAADNALCHGKLTFAAPKDRNIANQDTFDGASFFIRASTLCRGKLPRQSICRVKTRMLRQILLAGTSSLCQFLGKKLSRQCASPDRPLIKV